MTKLSGGEHIEIELLPARRRRWFRRARPPSVRITLEFATAYEAAIAYDAASDELRAGRFRLNVTPGEKVEETPL